MATNDDRYFEEYENLEVHELMLKDRPRQDAYRKAILSNRQMFEGKTVLDVGAGTGILSMFCAQAGAKVVYAVEPTKVAEIALQIIKDNDLTSIVKVVNSKIEDFYLPPIAGKVDIIVSEWMGFYLLHEGMLDSIIYARENFLKPDGILFPSEATIYIAPCEVPHAFDDWNSLDGFNLQHFAKRLREQKANTPTVALVQPKDLLHEGVALHWMNLAEVTLEDLDEIKFKDVLATQRAGKIQGFCIWFECRFPSENWDEAVVLSTSPKMPATHWKQSIVVLPEEACEDAAENTPVAFQIFLARNANSKRKYNIELEMLNADTEVHPMPCDCFMTRCILVKTHLQTMEGVEET